MTEAHLELELFSGDGQPWPNSVMLKGRDSILLVDSQFLKKDAQDLVDAIRKTGLPVSNIFFTHSHPDHVWGSVEVMKAFPNAKAWARPMVKQDIELDFRGRLLRWQEIFREQVPTDLPPIHPLEGDSFDFEGHRIEFVDNIGCETIFSTGFYIPESKTYVAGDHLYKDCHFYVGSGLNRPDLWAQSLRELKANYAIDRIAPGHGSLGGTEIIDFAIEYLDYYRSIYNARMPQLELAEKLKTRFPQLTLEGVLYITCGPGLTTPAVIEQLGGHMFKFGSHKPL